MKKVLTAIAFLSTCHSFAVLPDALRPEGDSNPFAARIHSMQSAHSFHVAMIDGKCPRTMTQLQVLFDDVRNMGVYNSRLLLEQAQAASAQASNVEGYDESVFRGYSTTIMAMTVDGRNNLKSTVYSVDCNQDADLMNSIIFATNMVRESKLKLSTK